MRGERERVSHSCCLIHFERNLVLFSCVQSLRIKTTPPAAIHWREKAKLKNKELANTRAFPTSPVAPLVGPTNMFFTIRSYIVPRG